MPSPHPDAPFTHVGIASGRPYVRDTDGTLWGRSGPEWTQGSWVYCGYDPEGHTVVDVEPDPDGHYTLANGECIGAECDHVIR